MKSFLRSLGMAACALELHDQTVIDRRTKAGKLRGQRRCKRCGKWGKVIPDTERKDEVFDGIV